MNKFLIGLLLVAAGAGVFFLLRKKKNVAAPAVNKEWIIGAWQTEKTMPGDSVKTTVTLDFGKDGKLLRSRNDAPADTAAYSWKGEKELQLPEIFPAGDKDSSGNSGQVFEVVRLTTDSLQLRSADSTETLFIKRK